MHFQYLIVSLCLIAVGNTSASPYSYSDEDEQRAASAFPPCTVIGNFSHPASCTKYMYCTSLNLAAAEKECPECKVNPISCPSGKLHYDQESKQCTWATEAKCPHPTTTTTTTTTEKPKEECEVDCTQTGYCACFDTCIADNSSTPGYGNSVKVYCEANLWWNDDAQTSSKHGGSCDFWSNLSPKTQETYQNDPECLDTPSPPCHWRPHDSCDNKYHYLPKNKKNHHAEETLYCPVSQKEGHLYWSQTQLTCVRDCPKGVGNCKVCKDNLD